MQFRWFRRWQPGARKHPWHMAGATGAISKVVHAGFATSQSRTGSGRSDTADRYDHGMCQLAGQQPYHHIMSFDKVMGRSGVGLEGPSTFCGSCEQSSFFCCRHLGYSTAQYSISQNCQSSLEARRPVSHFAGHCGGCRYSKAVREVHGCHDSTVFIGVVSGVNLGINSVRAMAVYGTKATAHWKSREFDVLEHQLLRWWEGAACRFRRANSDAARSVREALLIRTDAGPRLNRQSLCWIQGLICV